MERFTHDPSHHAFPEMTQAWMGERNIPSWVRVTKGPKVVTGPVDVVVVTAVPVTVVDTGAVVASVGTFMQTDSLQTIPAGHAFPHIPQFSALDESS
jgi:hypothetical protein